MTVDILERVSVRVQAVGFVMPFRAINIQQAFRLTKKFS
jgi:hypothetical protein